MAKVSEFKGTSISTVTGMSGHAVRLTVSQSSTTSGATGTTTLTWRLYYDLSKAASIQTGSNRSTTFKLAGKTITSNWNLGGTLYSGPGYVELGTGTVTISRTLSNADAYNITGQITSTHILTSTNSWSSGKGPGTTGSYTIKAVTLATNITGPTSFSIDKNRIAFKTNTSTTFSWKGQASGTNNTIGMTLQYKWRNADWADWLSLSESSKTITWGEGGHWTDFNEGEIIQFRIKAVGETLKDTKYSSTVEVKVNNVPTLNPSVDGNIYISGDLDSTTKSFKFNATDLNGDTLSYEYKKDGGNWSSLEEDENPDSLSLEFDNKNNHTVYFRVSDGYDTEEKEIELILSELLTFDKQQPVTLSFETPDINNSKLTKLLTSAKAHFEGGAAPYTYNWTLKNGDEKITEKTTNLSQIKFSPNGREIIYSLTVKDCFGVEISTEEISTGYFTPSMPEISSLEIFKDNTFSGVDGFYNGFKYEYKIKKDDTFSSINNYEFFVYRKDGEGNIELKATHDEAKQVFNFESEGTNKHFLKLIITDAFGQTAEKESKNSLNRLYHLNELFNSTNSINQNPKEYKPLSMKEADYFISYPASFNPAAKEQFFKPTRDAGDNITGINNPFGLNISVYASYGNEEWASEKNLFDKVKLLSEGFKINLEDYDEEIFTKDIKSRVPITYTITFSFKDKDNNDFDTLIINQNNNHYVEFREAPIFNNNSFLWCLNGKEENNKLKNLEDEKETECYLSYGDTLYIPIADNVSDLNNNDKDDYNDIKSYSLKVLNNDIEVLGTTEYKNGELVWINKNRESTLSNALTFKVTITDSTGLSTTEEITCKQIKFHACRSTYPKIRVNTTGGNKTVTFTIEDRGDDEGYKNYLRYNSNQVLPNEDEKPEEFQALLSNLFGGLIYSDTKGYNLNEKHKRKFKFKIDNITDGYKSDSIPNILYCTYVPEMNLASGTQYTDIPDLTWIWFGDAPTISPRKNRLGINVKAEGMGGDSLIEVHMANTEKKCVKFIGIASQNSKPPEIILDLSEGKISGVVLSDVKLEGVVLSNENLEGIIFSGGTWD